MIDSDNLEGHENLWLQAHELSDEDLEMRVRNNFCWIIFDTDGYIAYLKRILRVTSSDDEEDDFSMRRNAFFREKIETLRDFRVQPMFAERLCR